MAKLSQQRRRGLLSEGALPELTEVSDQQWEEHKRDFMGAWKAACGTAGCPNKIVHPFRRTSVRNLTRCGIPERMAMADRPQNAQRLRPL
jgi:hypothetical protein